MEESGKMVDYDKEYVEYKTYKENVMNSLGIKKTDHLEGPLEILPILRATYKLLNGNLFLETTTRDKVQRILDLFDEGCEYVFSGHTELLLKDLGLEGPIEEDDDPDGTEGEVLDEAEPYLLGRNVESMDEWRSKCVLIWTNVMSCLITRLKINFSSLFTDSPIQGCPCECGTGETWEKWESYTSSNLNNEEYDEPYDDETTTSDLRVCGCQYR